MTTGARRDPSPAAAEALLVRFERAMQLPLVLAALLPILLWLADRRTPLSIGVAIASWVVFVVDLVVHLRLQPRYVSSWRGRFDLGIVVLTGPWSLLPGLSGSGFLVLARLGRVGRVVLVTKHARRLTGQLGRAFVVGVAVVLVCADIAFHAERATNAGFRTYTDSLWWAIVTICTVGYGDITPRTGTGRWAGVVLMVTGIGIIGALAGTLAGFLRLAPSPGHAGQAGDTGPSPHSPPARRPATGLPADVSDEEITMLRSHLGVLDAELAALERRAGSTGEVRRRPYPNA